MSERTIPTPDTTIAVGDVVKSYDFPEDLVYGPRPGVGGNDLVSTRPGDLV